MSLTGTALSALTNASPLNGKADTLVREAGALGGTGTKDKDRIEKAGKDFESLLLSQWLQEAEEAFTKVPGADGDEGADPGSDSMQGLAMQSLGQAMSASGGIGIARMITSQLERKAAAAPPTTSVTPDTGYQESSEVTEQVS